MSDKTIENMNRALYAASYHLLEAAKYLTDIEEWRPAAMELLQRAQLMANTIQADEPKITQEKAFSILDEILNSDVIDTTAKETK